MLLGLVFPSCEKEEMPVIPEVTDVEFMPGNLRAKLKFNTKGNELAEKIVIFWNNLQEQQEFAVNENKNDSAYEVILDNLKEGDIEFNIYLKDANDIKSELKSVKGHIYGSDYIQSLPNRIVAESKYGDTETVIKWNDSPETAVGLEVKYTDQNDNLLTETFGADINITVLQNVKAGSTIKFRTHFKPEGNAIDTFYSTWGEAEIGLPPLEEYLLDKSLIKEYHLNNDREGQHYGGSIAKLFDDIINVDNFYSSAGGEQPLTFTVDLGQDVVLGKLTITGRPAIPDRIPREWDVWAIRDISDADTETPTSDFSTWESESIEKGWKMVASFNDEYGAPEPDPDWDNPPVRDYEIPEDRNAKYRYLRIRIKRTWQEGLEPSGQEVNIGEIDIYGKK